MPRPTRMIFRDERYISDAARALIEIVSQFNWEAPSKKRRAARINAVPGSVSQLTIRRPRRKRSAQA